MRFHPVADAPAPDARHPKPGVAKRLRAAILFLLDLRRSRLAMAIREHAHSAFAVEALAHFLAGLEKRNALLLDGDVRPGARITPGAGRPVLDRESAEAAQLDAIAAGERGDDLAQDGIDDVLDVALIEMRVLRRDTLDELGFDHRIAAPGRRRLAIPRRRNGPPDTPLAQFALEGCQRAKRPSRLTRSSACTVPESASARASEPSPTASSALAAARCRKERSLKRGRSCQSMMRSLGSMLFSLASQ